MFDYDSSLIVVVFCCLDNLKDVLWEKFYILSLLRFVKKNLIF